MLPECTQRAEGGCLYIVSTPIGNLSDFSNRAAAILGSVDTIACEDTRVTGKLLDHLNIPAPKLVSYRNENEKKQSPILVEEIQKGASIALVSDAGTPTLSDPGFCIVRDCRKAGIRIYPVPGPCALIAALSASGLPTHAFTFLGFLPSKSAARKRVLAENADLSHTLIVYESTHRIEKLIPEIQEILGPDRVIGIARELTKKHETVLVGKISDIYSDFEQRSKKGEFVVLIAPKSYQF